MLALFSFAAGEFLRRVAEARQAFRIGRGVRLEDIPS